MQINLKGSPSLAAARAAQPQTRARMQAGTVHAVAAPPALDTRQSERVRCCDLLCQHRDRCPPFQVCILEAMTAVAILGTSLTS